MWQNIRNLLAIWNEWMNEWMTWYCLPVTEVQIMANVLKWVWVREYRWNKSRLQAVERPNCDFTNKCMGVNCVSKLLCSDRMLMVAVKTDQLLSAAWVLWKWMTRNTNNLQLICLKLFEFQLNPNFLENTLRPVSILVAAANRSYK